MQPAEMKISHHAALSAISASLPIEAHLLWRLLAIFPDV